MGYIKEPTGIDFVVESKDWTEAEKNEMRNIMKASKAQKIQRFDVAITRRTKAKV
jgi:hypothetical protein